MNALLKLIDYGQSYWLDNLTRKMIKSGELKEELPKKAYAGILLTLQFLIKLYQVEMIMTSRSKN